MELNLTPQRIAMIIGAFLLSVGFYLGLTPRESNLMTVVCLGGGTFAMAVSVFFWAKGEKEREQRSVDKFMRGMDNMPKPEAGSAPAVARPVVPPSASTTVGTAGSAGSAGTVAPSRVANTAGGSRISNANNSPTKAKVSIQDLPSFDAEEDWGVYEEKNIKKK